MKADLENIDFDEYFARLKRAFPEKLIILDGPADLYQALEVLESLDLIKGWKIRRPYKVLQCEDNKTSLLPTLSPYLVADRDHIFRQYEMHFATWGHANPGQIVDAFLRVFSHR